MKSWISAALAGAVVVFVWGFVSWMVLPWHQATLNVFKDEAAVARALEANAPQAGMYVLPMRGETQEAKMERMAAGPFMFASVRPGSRALSFPRMLAGQFAIQLLGAILMVLLLTKAAIEGYKCRVMFVTMVGLTAGIMAVLPNWQWWEFDTAYTLVVMADLIIGWFLAGLVMAKLLPPSLGESACAIKDEAAK